MTNLSNERLEELSVEDDLHNYPPTQEELNGMARELLALREAQKKPIGSFHIVDQRVDGTTDYVKDGEWPIDNGELLVYAAPQLPAVADTIDYKAMVLQLAEIAHGGPIDIGLLPVTVRSMQQLCAAPQLPDEREAFENFMVERFGESIDQRRAKNGDNEYMAWDKAVAWTVWQHRATIAAAPTHK